MSNSVLKRLFSNETIKVNATDGKVTIAQSAEVFESWLDPDFKNWNLDNFQASTKEMPVEAYEVVKDADFKTMLGSLNEDLDKLCLTQSQIVDFCKNYKDRLNPNWGTFFLFKEGSRYFVAFVYVYSVGLFVYVHHFEYAFVWLAGYAHRLVVPQLEA
ncbi:MAG: hypothetical protein K9M44_03165 [Candidatus Pacebacteria bacterium]|nr:hypothetical protein [Candidatus Paceibacterota bacterium]